MQRQHRCFQEFADCMENFKVTVTRQMLVKICSAICIFLFVKSPLDLWKYTTILSFGVLISQIYLFANVKSYVSFSIVSIKDLFRSQCNCGLCFPGYTDGEISFVLITGDCLHQNRGNLKEIASYISQIAEACGIDVSRVILCPGNHDIDRKIKSRNTAIKTYRKDGTLPDLETCLNGYGRFKELYTLLYGDIYEPFSLKTIDDFRIISVDSCLLSMDDRDYGKLVVSFTNLAELARKIKSDESKTNIVIMHHGVEWLSAEDGRRFQHWLVDNNVKAVFCGHNHAPGLSILTEAIKPYGIPQGGVSQFTCGCTLSDSYSRPVFLVAEYDRTKAIKARLYEYRGDSSWEIASGVLRSFPSGIYRESTTNGMVKNSYDIPKVYKNIFDIGTDVALDIKVSKKLAFFGLRGGTFLEGNSKIANALYEKGKDIECRLLVSDPYSIYIEKRLRNVPEFAPQEKLEKQWKTNYLDIKKLKDTFPKTDGWALRFHEQPLLYRFIITDRSIYLGYYTREPSSKSYMYRYMHCVSAICYIFLII